MEAGWRCRALGPGLVLGGPVQARSPCRVFRRGRVALQFSIYPVSLIPKTDGKAIGEKRAAGPGAARPGSRRYWRGASTNGHHGPPANPNDSSQLSQLAPKLQAFLIAAATVGRDLAGGLALCSQARSSETEAMWTLLGGFPRQPQAF